MLKVTDMGALAPRQPPMAISDHGRLRSSMRARGGLFLFDGIAKTSKRHKVLK